MYKAVKERMHSSIIVEKYDELYAEKYREIYNKYLDENPLKEGEDRTSLVNRAMDFAS